MKSTENLARMKTVSNKQFEKKYHELEKDFEKEFSTLIKGGAKNES